MRRPIYATLFALSMTASLFGQNEPATEPVLSPLQTCVQGILQKENDEHHRKNIETIVTNLEETYCDLLPKLQQGKKITIFIDPAHGLMPNGVWQSAVTYRLSASGKPEEYYSLLIARELYSLLAKNPSIEVQTTKDFLAALKGSRETYMNIPFSTTVSMAKESKAFLIVSEHLNNVSIIHKASGLANIPGIHIILDGADNKILRFVRGTNSGFLTLYNELDISGFSKAYAINVKENLVQKGLRPNGWEFGAVADDRFTYFTDFPLSVIFESGFISHPDEEKKLRDPEYVRTLAQGQYEALVRTISEMFGVDISGQTPEKKGESRIDRLELLTLSRVALYYFQNMATDRGLRVLRTLESRFAGSKYRSETDYYVRLRQNIAAAERYFSEGVRHQKKRQFRKARRDFLRARQLVRAYPLLFPYRLKYAESVATQPVQDFEEPVIITKTERFIALTPPSPGKNIILPIDEQQSLEEAISHALDPDEETLKKLTKELKNAMTVDYERVVRFSKKRGKKVVSWQPRPERVHFTPGIYIVKLSRSLKVQSVKRVPSVYLDASRYQNQQYLKNSCFASGEKEKSL